MEKKRITQSGCRYTPSIHSRLCNRPQSKRSRASQLEIVSVNGDPPNVAASAYGISFCIVRMLIQRLCIQQRTWISSLAIHGQFRFLTIPRPLLTHCSPGTDAPCHYLPPLRLILRFSDGVKRSWYSKSQVRRSIMKSKTSLHSLPYGQTQNGVLLSSAMSMAHLAMRRRPKYSNFFARRYQRLW